MEALNTLLQQLAVIDWDAPWKLLQPVLNDPVLLAIVGAVAAVLLLLALRTGWIVFRRLTGKPVSLIPARWWRGRARRQVPSPPPSIAASRAVALVIGDAAGGGNLDLARADLPRDPAADTGSDRRWQMLRRIALLDTTGMPLLANPGEPASSEEDWDALIDLLLDWRPTRPVDAVVLTVAASRLTGPSALEGGGLTALGEAAARRVARLQDRAGRRLPVYVVVSGYDAVPGFDALVQHVVGARRGQMVGWSNGLSLEAAYDDQLVEEATAQVAGAFERHQPALLLARSGTLSDQREAVLALGAVTRALTEPLKRVLSPVFRESAARDVPWLRGVYVSGAARPDHRAMRASADATARPILLADLFDDRIADEVGIAAPSLRVTSLQRRRRNRAAAVAAGVAAAALVTAVLGLQALQRSAAELTSAMIALDDALIAPTATSSERAVLATRMTAALAELDRIPDATAFNPLSFVFGLDGVLDPVVSERLAASVGPQIVQDTLRRAGILLQTPARLDGDDAVAAMTAWVEDALAVEQDVGAVRTARVETSAVRAGAVQGLVHRTYRVKLPAMSEATAHRIAGAIASAAKDVRFDLAGISGHLVPKMIAAAPNLSRSPAGGFPILRQLDGVNRTLGRLVTVRADPGQIAAGTTRRLAGDLDGLANALAGSGTATSDVIALTALLATVQASPLLGPEVTSAIRTGLAARSGAVRAAIEPYRYPVAPAPVAILSQSGEIPSLSPPVTALNAQLSTLIGAAFFRPAAGVSLRTTLEDTTFMSWDAGGLQAVLDLYGDYDAFTVSLEQGGGDLTPELRSILTALAGRGLVDAMDARLATAQSITRPVAPGDAAALESSLGLAASSLQGNLVALNEVQGVLLKFRSVSTAGDFAAANRENAAAMLSMANQVYHRASGTQYDPQTPWSLWDGNETATTFAYGIGDTSALANYLAAARGRASTVARRYTAPAVAFLRAGSIGLSPGEQANLAGWNATLTTLTDYDNGVKRGNTLAEMESFFAMPLLSMTAASCTDDLSKVPAPRITDLFSREFSRIYANVSARCAELDRGQVDGRYDEIVSLFESDLLPYFPFAPAASPNAPPSSRQPAPPIPPSVVRSTAAAFAAVEPEARKELAFLARNGGDTADAIAFLDDLTASLSLLSALVPATANGPSPAITIAPSFRLGLTGAAGDDQVLEWTLTAGSAQAVYPIAVTNLAWALGTPVSMAFRWPKNGPVTPASGAGYAWSDHTVTFSPNPAGDPWSLLRLMLAHPAPGAAFALSAKGRDPNVLSFDVATNQTSTNADGQPATKSATASLFVRLGLTGKDATGKEVALTLPTFPNSAPALPSANGSAKASGTTTRSGATGG